VKELLTELEQFLWVGPGHEMDLIFSFSWAAQVELLGFKFPEVELLHPF
jgi:hypothetical protein